MLQRRLVFQAFDASWASLAVLAAVIAAATLVVVLSRYERKLVPAPVGYGLLVLRLCVIAVAPAFGERDDLAPVLPHAQRCAEVAVQREVFTEQCFDSGGIPRRGEWELAACWQEFSETSAVSENSPALQRRVPNAR